MLCKKVNYAGDLEHNDSPDNDNSQLNVAVSHSLRNFIYILPDQETTIKEMMVNTIKMVIPTIP